MVDAVKHLSAEPIIRVQNLRNSFGNFVVHENLNLDIKKGEILGIVGGSGTGKSVLLRAIIGLRPPNAGEVIILGQNVAKISGSNRSLLDQRLGVLFQSGALFSSLTVIENIALPLIEHIKLKRRDAEHIAAMKIALTGLPASAGIKYPSELSGGMIKRAALARALALDPDILFLDEPTAGLDPISAAAFDELLRTLCSALGFTVFMVTHDLDSLYAICDRVAVLAEKRILVCDTIEKVQQHPNSWVQEYFNGPRGKVAQYATKLGQGEK